MWRTEEEDAGRHTATADETERRLGGRRDGIDAYYRWARIWPVPAATPVLGGFAGRRRPGSWAKLVEGFGRERIAICKLTTHGQGRQISQRFLIIA